MINDLDRRLSADGAHWRAEGHAVPPLQEALAVATGTTRQDSARDGEQHDPPPQAEPLALHRPSGPEPHPSAGHWRRHGWAVAAAVACAALITIGAVALANRGPGRQASPGTAPAGIVGYRWKLTQVIDGHGTLTVSGRRLVLAFTPDGYLSGNDGCNGLHGRYRFHNGGFTVHDVFSTQVLCKYPVGSAQARIKTAVDAAFNLPPPDAITHAPPEIATRLDGSTLRLTIGSSGITIVTERAGRPPDAVTGATPTTPIPSTTPISPTR